MCDATQASTAISLGQANLKRQASQLLIVFWPEIICPFWLHKKIIWMRGEKKWTIEVYIYVCLLLYFPCLLEIIIYIYSLCECLAKPLSLSCFSNQWISWALSSVCPRYIKATLQFLFNYSNIQGSRQEEATHGVWQTKPTYSSSLIS